jgi:Na+/melibiose symporter-like transporter
MNLDDLIESWRSQDASTFYGVLDKTLLHQALRQEQAEREKQQRMGTRVGYVGSAVLLITAGLFLAIMIDPNQPPTFAARLIVWDYVVGIAGLAGAIVVAWTLFALRRSQQAREQGFGDSLRDHLRRRLAQIDDEATVERRLGLTTLAAGLICAMAITIAQFRIAHVPVPYSEMPLPSLTWAVLIVVLLCLELFRWGPRRWRRHNLPRKRQLEALLKELDG